MQKAAVFACLSLVGCTQIFGLSDPVRHVDAAIDVMVDSNACTNPSLECVSVDVLRTCAGEGAAPIDTTCSWGCAADGCNRLVPAGGSLLATDLDETASLSNVSLSSPTTINTDTGSISGVRADGAGISNGIRFEARPGGGVFTFAELAISANVTVVGSRPLMIVARGEVTISALLDVRGTCSGTAPGPGGGRGGNSGENGVGAGAGDSDGTAAEDANNGGGGGSYGSRGGGGGDNAAGSGGGGAAGAIYGTATLTPLAGGSGGAGGSDGAGGGLGGGGGGAVQIISNDRITISGGINAGGCGGHPANTGDSGGGGGSGGAILLEAPLVIVSGGLAANGGGGGAGDGGSRGAAGGLTAQRAEGGLGTALGGDGGDGAAGTILDGGNGQDDDLGGGGGGGVGRIRLNTRDGAANIAGTAVVSPPLTSTAATQDIATVN